MHSVKLLHEPLHLTEYKPKQEILRPNYEFHNAISCQKLAKLNKLYTLYLYHVIFSNKFSEFLYSIKELIFYIKSLS